MLNNSLYQTIMRDYNRRQAEARHAQDLRTQEIFTKLPEYETLEQEIITLCAGEARARVLAPDKERRISGQELHDRIALLKSRQLALLRGAGYPEDYLELQYTCPLCRDTGFSGNDLCSCFRQAAARHIYDQAKIAPLLEKENFDTFRIDYYSEAVDPVLASARQKICARSLQDAGSISKTSIPGFPIFLSTAKPVSVKAFLPTVLPTNCLRLPIRCFI